MYHCTEQSNSTLDKARLGNKTADILSMLEQNQPCLPRLVHFSTNPITRFHQKFTYLFMCE
jgi:hypothetical protein